MEFILAVIYKLAISIFQNPAKIWSLIKITLMMLYKYLPLSYYQKMSILIKKNVTIKLMVWCLFVKNKYADDTSNLLN